jgi:hypothetical protein
VALVIAAGASGAPAAKELRVTVVADSVGASLDYVTDARKILARGRVLKLDLKVCRRLVQPSCTYRGVKPTSALEAVRGYGRRLGDVLVIKVGYNEGAKGYREGIDRVMRAALKNGVGAVVWVTLRERRDTYRWTNIAIRIAAKRWKQLTVADWARHSKGKPWFASDGLHMTPNGARALARFLNANIRAATSG